MTAAKGSYTEMYSDVPCDEASLARTKAGYDATMQRMNATAAPVDKPQLAPSASAAATPTPTPPPVKSPAGRQF